MSGSVLVLGGGIAGIQAALDLAEAGCKVVLVEREPTLGGKMAALDKNFPTLDCSICIEAPKIGEVVKHPNIEVITLGELVSLTGEAGAFTATIEQRARFVTNACTRCNECAAVCPQSVPNEFDEGLGSRKAIYTPAAQAEPGAYVIDPAACLNDPPNYLPCGRCTAACGPKCIDFTLPRMTRHIREVASVIVATGFDLFDSGRIPEYGYGKHPDVLTAMEFERMLNAAGPTEGEIVRPSTGAHPHRALFVLCVGSRDERFCHSCSRICCMYSMKEAFQAKEHGVDDVTILYMDIRAYGKGFDDFYRRTREEGVRFLRGRPSSVTPTDGLLRVRYEDTNEGRVREEDFDLVILAPAVTPSKGAQALAKSLSLELDEDGFLKVHAEEGGMQRTTRDGVYVAGCASGAKDIPDTVAEASGAAAAAMAHVSERGWPEEEHVTPIDVSGDARVGVFVCDCGSNIAGTIRVPEVVENAKTMPGVVHAEELMFACAAMTQEHIAQTVKEKGLTRVVVAACSPKTHSTTFQKACARVGLNPYLVEMANLRNHASWVHRQDKPGATSKGKDLVSMAVEKAKRLAPLQKGSQHVTPRAIVVGGGLAGMSAASALARQGFDTHLVEKTNSLGGLARQLHHISGLDADAASLVERNRREVEASGVHVHLGAEVREASGHVGKFRVTLSTGDSMDVGAIVVATGARPHETEAFGHGKDPRVVTNLELEPLLEDVRGERVTFLGCVGSRQGPYGCSRYCCSSMIQQALTLQRAGNNVRIVSKDIRTYGRHAEELYTQACREGVRFFRTSDGGVPVEELAEWREGNLVFDDVLSGQRLALPTDRLVLATALRSAGANSVSEQLKLTVAEDGALLESHPKLAPIEAAVAGVFLAGACQGPKDAGESIAQGLAAASKAAALLAAGDVEQEPIKAIIDPLKCTGCTMCAKVCPHNAIVAEVKKPAVVIEAACAGCGTCAATCPSGAITMPSFTDEQVLSQVDAATAESPSEKVVVFACNWCSYAGADQAGVAKFQYPPSSRIIRTMCSGRVSEKFVLRALERGAGAVIITGCHPGSCHYLTANLETEKRIGRWKKKLEAKGIDPARLQLAWVSAAEGKRFAEKMVEMHGRRAGHEKEGSA
ncbi:MAG: FAD-dependent oxidoreductase [Candidatus Thermoplasmatota archaeon]